MNTDYFKSYRKDILDVLAQIEANPSWCTQEELLKSAEHAIDECADLYDMVSTDIDILRSARDDSQKQTEVVAHLFRSWHVGVTNISTPAIMSYAINSLGLQLDKELTKAMLLASVLAEIHNAPSYHCNMHFREVTFQILRMILTHNDIYKSTSKVMNGEESALMLLTAAIHDLGHTGQGNTVDGKHVSAYLETRSYDLIEPYLQACGLDRIRLQKIRTMLVATDTSPIDSDDSPSRQMKRAFEHHFQHKTKLYRPVLSQNLIMLEEDERLTMMALMLHEADISISAGVNYEVTSYETSLLWEEMGRLEPQPSDIINFLDKICQRRFLSDAGRRLFSANMARIYALAEDAVKNGDVPFPRPHHTNFILGISEEHPKGKPLH